MKSKNINYLPALNHIRAFAAILIIVYHGMYFLGQPLKKFYTNNPLFSLFIEGHTAVSLFMVLSGFLFTYGALGYRINYLGFIKNRFLRIYPLFFVLLFIGIYRYPDRFTWLGFFKTVFFQAYAPDSLKLGITTILFWSVSVEFQFYLIFPFLIYVLRRFGIKSFVILITGVVAYRFVAVYYGARIDYMSYWSLYGRIDQFLIGMIAAKVFSVLDRKTLKHFLIPSIITIFVIMFIFHKLGGGSVWERWRLVWPTVEGVAWALFLISYTALINSNSNRIFSAFTKIGDISYSMYLLHFSVWYILTLNNLIPKMSASPLLNVFMNSLLIVLPITMTLSAITYIIVEKPFLRLRSRYLKPFSVEEDVALREG